MGARPIERSSPSSGSPLARWMSSAPPTTSSSRSTLTSSRCAPTGRSSPTARSTTTPTRRYDAGVIDALATIDRPDPAGVRAARRPGGALRRVRTTTVRLRSPGCGPATASGSRARPSSRTTRCGSSCTRTSCRPSASTAPTRSSNAFPSECSSPSECYSPDAPPETLGCVKHSDGSGRRGRRGLGGCGSD